MVPYRRSRQLWGAAIALSCIVAPTAAVATEAALISPDDRHFQTLQELGERYDCPLEGESALTREEFAMGLQNCFQTIRTQQMMRCILMPIVSPEDAVLFEELDGEFAEELEELGEGSDRLNFLYPFEISPETPGE